MNWVFETQRLLLKPILESDLNALHYIFINFYFTDDGNAVFTDIGSHDEVY